LQKGHTISRQRLAQNRGESTTSRGPYSTDSEQVIQQLEGTEIEEGLHMFFLGELAQNRGRIAIKFLLEIYFSKLAQILRQTVQHLLL
jgi:hypothetical protein